MAGITARLRASKRRRQQTEDKGVYAAVDRRDGLKSRLRGIYGGDSIERHHIVPRSLGGKTTTANVISLTQREHRKIHAGDLRLWPVGDVGADGIVAWIEREPGGEWGPIQYTPWPVVQP